MLRLFYYWFTVSLNYYLKFSLKTYPSWIDDTQTEASTPWTGFEWFNSESTFSAAKRAFVSASSKVPINHTTFTIIYAKF